MNAKDICTNHQNQEDRLSIYSYKDPRIIVVTFLREGVMKIMSPANQTEFDIILKLTNMNNLIYIFDVSQSG